MIEGLIEPGNIDLGKRPVVRNADGSISTVRSIGANFDGREVLIPTVSDDGRILSDQDAIRAFQRTGRHLGMFKTPEASSAYAESLHKQQAAQYLPKTQPQTLGAKTMKISEIREKFPQYKDLPDEQLVIGLHRKYYSDLPFAQFNKAVEYDVGADPTKDMSAFERGAAGAGKAIADIGRGAGQMFGLVSRDDVAEASKRDAALMKTTGGAVGNFAGNVAALLPTAFIPGANTLAGAGAIGAATGLMQPSTSTRETLTNTALGGLAAPAAIGVARGGQALYQGAKGLAEPLTKAGQERLASEVFRRSATDPARAAARAAAGVELVPGSKPTMAQIAQDPGLAQLERTILNNPEYAPALQQRFGNQRAARLEAVQNIAGKGDYYDAIKEGRRVFANEDYGKAIAQGIDQDMAKAVQPQIESLMRRPSMQEAQKVAQRIAKEKDVSLTDFGSVEGLDWIKKAIDKQINAIKTGNPIGKTDLDTLLTTKADLMSTLEQIAPAYKQANQNFAAMSRQVNSMDVARDLLATLNKPGAKYAQPGTAREMGDAYSTALAKAVESVKKSTGMNRALSDVMPTADVFALENVARDIGRKSAAENLGRAVGSNTVQNMASQNMLRRILGPTGMPESWAESTMLQSLLSPVQAASKLTGADKKVLDLVAAGLLDPMAGVGMLSARPSVRNVGLLGAPEYQRFLPAAGLLATTSGER